MGALLAIPIAGLALCCTVAVFVAIFSVFGWSILSAIKAVLRQVPALGALIPDDPPSQEEIDAENALKAEREAEKQREIEQEIEEAAREMRRPTSREDAVEKLRIAMQAVKDAEACVDAALAVAKEKGGGWNLVGEARDRLEQAEASAEEVTGDAANFGVAPDGKDAAGGGAKGSAGSVAQSGPQATSTSISEGGTKVSAQGDPRHISATKLEHAMTRLPPASAFSPAVTRAGRPPLQFQAPSLFSTHPAPVLRARGPAIARQALAAKVIRGLRRL